MMKKTEKRKDKCMEEKILMKTNPVRKITLFGGGGG